MSFPLLIDSTNSINQNQFRVSLANTTDLSSFDVSVGQAFVYNAWANISSNFNNNTFQLTIPTSGASVIVTLTIPDGGYNISDLNNYLQFWLISNGYYLTNTATGLNTYYAAFELSPTSYSVQFITYPLPTSLPAGFTSGGMTFPLAVNQHYQLTVLPNAFRDLIGFNSGTYPAVPTNVGTQTKVSDYTPNVATVSVVQMRLSCCNSPFSDNNQLLHTFASGGVPFGALINASATYDQRVPCSGSHRDLVLTLTDQLGRPLLLLDKNIIIKLLFTRRS